MKTKECGRRKKAGTACQPVLAPLQTATTVTEIATRCLPKMGYRLCMFSITDQTNAGSPRKCEHFPFHNSTVDRHLFVFFSWSLLYSAIPRFRANSLRSYVILREWLAFLQRVFQYPSKRCTYTADMAGDTKLLPSRCVLCTPYNHATCHVISFEATYVRCTCV